MLSSLCLQAARDEQTDALADLISSLTLACGWLRRPSKPNSLRYHSISTDSLTAALDTVLFLVKNRIFIRE